MPGKQVNHYRRLLEDKETELRAALQRRDSIEIGERMPDSVDEFLSSSARDLAIRQLERDAALLRDVHAALERLDDGTYGICENCDDPIVPRRLDALPWARLCRACQEKADDRWHEEGRNNWNGVFDRAA